MAEKLSKKNFISKAIEVHGDKYDYSKTIYIKAKEPVIITCKKHGDFRQRPQDHILKACGCPKCKNEKIVGIHTYPYSQFKELAINKYGNKYEYFEEDYINMKIPIRIVCPIHGEFITTPASHLTSITGCSKCGREKANISESLTTDSFINKAKEIHNNKYNYSNSKYINYLTKICIICPEHGEFWQTPANHLQGQGCPKCQLKSQAKLYEKLKSRFSEIDILFEVNNSIVPWLDSQRFDIYFPKYNIAVEYNGEQHYIPIEHFGGMIGFENTVKRDEIKRKKCSENGCKLFEIEYNYTEEDFIQLCENIQSIIERRNFK